MTSETTRRGFLAAAGMAATTAGITTTPVLAATLHRKPHSPVHPAAAHHASTHHAHTTHHAATHHHAAPAHHAAQAQPASAHGHKLHATAKTAQRMVNMYNIHTRESAQVVYWQQGIYEAAAMRHIAFLMRDSRDHTTHRMDPRLMDLLHDLHVALGSHSQPFHLICGYRSPRSNAWLVRHTSGVAKDSLHLRGQASDIMVPSCPLDTLHNTALALSRGGVGYYPRSDFVHVDTGKVRHWDYMGA
jgi:uncharacterized protein YcbK (DUF882 family)